MENKTKIGQKLETWINQETGEVRIVQEVDIKGTDKGFEKIWLGMILTMLDIVGGKKIDVIKYLLKNRNRTENTIFATQRKIAESLKVSTKTVTETMIALKKVELISQVTPGCYRINPAVIWRGSHVGRMAIMAKFSQEKAITDTKEENLGQATLPGVTMPQTGTEG